MKKIIVFIVISCCSESFSHNIAHGKHNLTDVVEYVLLNDENSCARTCQKNSVPITCRYTFNLEWYHTLSKACFDCPFKEEDCYRDDCIPGDGNKRSVVVVNRKLPGPSIEVCLGDEVIVDVVNMLHSDNTAIHWHGQHLKDFPYMDGVPYVSQCPIQPGSTFRYHFNANNAGTHFWHSHIGFQRTDGTFGAFIVRVPKEDDPNSNLYDYDLSEHIITLLDWTREAGNEKYLNHYHNSGDNKADTILVNGLGKFQSLESPATNETVFTPTARFIVQQNSAYRFRVINAGFLNCPIEILIDDHTFNVISSDGYDFSATEVDSLVVYAGERFDFVVNATQEKRAYWIHFRGLMDCDERFTKAYQLAILQYEGADQTTPSDEPDYDNLKESGRQLNPLNVGIEHNDGESFVTMPELHSLVPVKPDDDTLKEKPDFQYYVSYDFYEIDNPDFHKSGLYGFQDVDDESQRVKTPQLNYITMKLLPFPILSQRDQLDESLFCNEQNQKNCESDFCHCPHVVKIRLDDVVEIVLVDKGYAYDANHPFHLHGYGFRVVAMGRVGSTVNVSQVQELDATDRIVRNLIDAPYKDTVTVPDGGYTIIRFKATNPGYWLFHCHIEFHAEVGMALVFKIGEHSDMAPVPKDFPTCGDYIPSGNDTQECEEVGTFSSILKKLLPKAYSDNCPPISKPSSAPIQSAQYSILVVMLLVLTANY